MAQMKPFEWGAAGNAPGYAGMKADVTADVIDSFACEGGCNPGDLVMRGTDAERQAKKAENGGKPLGVVVHIHKEPENGAYYPEGYALPIMTSGDIWVTAGGTVAAGDPVAYDAAKGYTKGTETAASGNMFLTGGAEGDVVKIRVRNPAAIAVSGTAAAAKVGEAEVGKSEV